MGCFAILVYFLWPLNNVLRWFSLLMQRKQRNDLLRADWWCPLKPGSLAAITVLTEVHCRAHEGYNKHWTPCCLEEMTLLQSCLL